MKVLIACEESQIVCKAFRDKGHEAYSCDILETSGDNPEWHIRDDIRNHLSKGWDMVIAFPTCTYLTNSGVRWLYTPEKNLIVDRWIKLVNAMTFFNTFKGIAPKICIENPIPHKWAVKGFKWKGDDEDSKKFGLDENIGIGKYTQIIQPWQFGHGEQKATCLWLEGLPELVPTDIVEGREQRIWKMPPSEDRSILRSKTFWGIADAMAEQWG